jgi:hypothetical protein
MKNISFADSFEVLCLQAADNGRGPILFGDCLDRVRTAGRPFMIGRIFPSVYLEFPLAGEPFLDVTILYGKLDAEERIASEAAAGSEPMLDWFASICDAHDNLACGFELDTKNEQLPAAAVHFQPRAHTELVEPFFATIGEPERAALYLDLAARMPPNWSLSFFGVFRGRPSSPLRVCGYLENSTLAPYAKDPRNLAALFDDVGFSAYDGAMLQQISELMAAAPGTVDFQFDVFPDGTLGDIFALDVQFGIQQPELVHESFETGPVARVMRLLEGWGTVDERWKLAADAAFARAIPVTLDDGTVNRLAFTLMPQWLKVRWSGTRLQPSKLYHLATTKLMEP